MPRCLTCFNFEQYCVCNGPLLVVIEDPEYERSDHPARAAILSLIEGAGDDPKDA